MTNETDASLQEAVLVNQDLHNMLLVWHERQADPLVVCTLMIIQFVSLAGHLFADEEEYERFLAASVKRGRVRFAESGDVPFRMN